MKTSFRMYFLIWGHSDLQVFFLIDVAFHSFLHAGLKKVNSITCDNIYPFTPMEICMEVVAAVILLALSCINLTNMSDYICKMRTWHFLSLIIRGSLCCIWQDHSNCNLHDYLFIELKNLFLCTQHLFYFFFFPKQF